MDIGIGIRTETRHRRLKAEGNELDTKDDRLGREGWGEEESAGMDDAEDDAVVINLQDKMAELDRAIEEIQNAGSVISSLEDVPEFI